MADIPDAQARREIAARAACDDRTIRRVYRHPDRTTCSAHHRITVAARALGIEPPPGRPRRAEPAR